MDKNEQVAGVRVDHTVSESQRVLKLISQMIFELQILVHTDIIIDHGTIGHT